MVNSVARRACSAESRTANPVVTTVETRAAHAAYMREWTRKNPEKNRARAAAWYKANLERARARSSAYKAANPERRRAWAAKWYANNPEKCRASSAKWEHANPERIRAKCSKRRANKLTAPGHGVAAAQWLGTLAASLGICAYCNERRPPVMDHVEPLAKGGAHDVGNIAVVCRSCNSSKSDTSLLLWLARRAKARGA